MRERKSLFCRPPHKRPFPSRSKKRPSPFSSKPRSLFPCRGSSLIFLPTGLFFRPFSQNRSGGHSSFGFSVRSNFAPVTFPVFATRYFARRGSARDSAPALRGVAKNQDGPKSKSVQSLRWNKKSLAINYFRKTLRLRPRCLDTTKMCLNAI